MGEGPSLLVSSIGLLASHPWARAGSWPGQKGGNPLLSAESSTRTGPRLVKPLPRRIASRREKARLACRRSQGHSCLQYTTPSEVPVPSSLAPGVVCPAQPPGTSLHLLVSIVHSRVSGDILLVHAGVVALFTLVGLASHVVEHVLLQGAKPEAQGTALRAAHGLGPAPGGTGRDGTSVPTFRDDHRRER